jgi:hypothetical protein
MMVQANQFCALPSEDASTHLQHFLERHTSKHQAPSVFLLPRWEGETMVLQGHGSHQHMGQMFHSVSHKIFPHGQNPCPEGENFEASMLGKP